MDFHSNYCTRFGLDIDVVKPDGMGASTVRTVAATRFDPPEPPDSWDFDGIIHRLMRLNDYRFPPPSHTIHVNRRWIAPYSNGGILLDIAEIALQLVDKYSLVHQEQHGWRQLGPLNLEVLSTLR